MKQVFKFSEQFQKNLRLKLEAVQEVTMEKVLEELMFYIKKDVYSKPESLNEFYERTYVLLKMFEVSKIYSKGGVYGGVYGGIETNSNIFQENQNASEWQNESKLDDVSSISATDFVSIINDGVKMMNDGNPENARKHSLFGERPATHFWEEFINVMYFSDEYKRLFLQSAKELKYPIVEGTYTSTKRKPKKGGYSSTTKDNRTIDIKRYNNI